MILDSSLWNLEMRHEWSVMVIGRLEAVLVLHLSPPSCTVLEHSWHHHSLQDRHHDQWDAARRRGHMQRISSSSRKYPILFQSWLVSGSPIGLTTSFDWKERRFRILDTGIESKGNLKGLDGTWSYSDPPARPSFGITCAIAVYKSTHDVSVVSLDASFGIVMLIEVEM